MGHPFFTAATFSVPARSRFSWPPPTRSGEKVSASEARTIAPETAEFTLVHVVADDVGEVAKGAFAGLLRTFGNGGFFSFTGGYWGREIGRATAYATDLGPGLLLRYPTRAVVLTPTEPAALAKALRRASGLPES